MIYEVVRNQEVMMMLLEQYWVCLFCVWMIHTALKHDVGGKVVKLLPESLTSFATISL